MKRTILMLLLTAGSLGACDRVALADNGDGAARTELQTAERVWNVTTMVNALPYSHGDLDTAGAAFRAVAANRGWPEWRIDAWAPFVRAVIGRESGGCWNVRYGQRAGDGCALSGRPHGTASGFGQVIFNSNRYLCGQEGLCSHWDIIASPWNSMTALVALVEHSGRSPWCYTAHLRRSAVCRS